MGTKREKPSKSTRALARRPIVQAPLAQLPTAAGDRRALGRSRTVEALFPAPPPKVELPSGYAKALGELKQRIEQTRLATVIAANTAMTRQEIRRCKRKHDAAFAEMLAFWTDNNTVHVERGTSELQQAVQVTNQCIADTGAAMTRLSSQRRTGAPPIAAAPTHPPKPARPPSKKTPSAQTALSPTIKGGGEIDLGSEPAETPASCKDKISDPKDPNCVKQFCAAHTEDARCAVE